ncbi:MAG: vitamin B12 dependent-methionine synthase activation domain-containing protein [Prevotella sp.]|nr:vitamin B12 dependent-methionine synthase activation domain-containing protein [Prevotella sp.]
MKITYEISQIVPYINWVYFYYAWGIHSRPEAEQQKLRQEAEEALQLIEDRYHTYALFELYEACSDGDDIMVSRGVGSEACSVRIPCLRQQQGNPPFYCLSDFISPHSSKLGVFATSVDHGFENDFDADPYQKMLMQLLADRLAEATAERMHQEVRKYYWGYAPDENLSIAEMQVEKFQGIRPAVGYPSLPDTSLNFVIDELLDMKQIGIRLTESGAMKPHASVSGLMMAHPQAQYFSLGKIGEDQLHDYARRRGLPVEVVRKFLAANL